MGAFQSNARSAQASREWHAHQSRNSRKRQTGKHVLYEGVRYPVYRVVPADYFYEPRIKDALYFNTRGNGWRHVFLEQETGWKYVK